MRLSLKNIKQGRFLITNDGKVAPIGKSDVAIIRLSHSVIKLYISKDFPLFCITDLPQNVISLYVKFAHNDYIRDYFGLFLTHDLEILPTLDLSESSAANGQGSGRLFEYIGENKIKELFIHNTSVEILTDLDKFPHLNALECGELVFPDDCDRNGLDFLKRKNCRNLSYLSYNFPKRAVLDCRHFNIRADIPSTWLPYSLTRMNIFRGGFGTYFLPKNMDKFHLCRKLREWRQARAILLTTILKHTFNSFFRRNLKCR